MRGFAYIPTGHRLKLTELHTHEYFGEDFQAGQMEAAIFKTHDGKRRVVWTSGSWGYFRLEKGDAHEFEHTQSCRKTTLYYEGYINKSVYHKVLPGDGKSIVQWTLK